MTAARDIMAKKGSIKYRDLTKWQKQLFQAPWLDNLTMHDSQAGRSADASGTGSPASTLCNRFLKGRLDHRTPDQGRSARSPRARREKKRTAPEWAPGQTLPGDLVGEVHIRFNGDLAGKDRGDGLARGQGYLHSSGLHHARHELDIGDSLEA